MSLNPPHSRDPRNSASDIAVIGMACRFPEADSPSEFWSLLRDGREAVKVLTDEDLRAAGVGEALLGDPNYVKAAIVLRHMDEFDPAFFGFSPLDARILDPQHRHFLECAWEALEDAGYDPEQFEGSIGVFAGSGHNSYLPYNLLSNPELVSDVGLFLLRHTGNDKDFLVTRASYLFDLKGPSINVQTACSTSLVAVHLAAQSLLNGECDMALAGGVTIELPHHQGYLYKEGEILSRDGHCRPFDSSAGGTVFGSGVGVVMLKRLDEAISDGDNIHAVIKASAVNNDGADKVSYLAPSVDGQAASVQEALVVGGIAPESVTYIETHGTGTQLGDPIEVEALTQAYGTPATSAQSIGIGSVKSNIGHLDTAAGVASLIKVILALKHRQLPPSLNYEGPNRAINLSDGPFYVNSQLREWQSPGPLRAAVSSLGVGGTNAHVILEEAPVGAETSPGRPAHLLLISARTGTALREACARQALYLRGEGKDDNLADIEYTLVSGRRHFRRRIAVVARSAEEAAAAFEGIGDVASARVESPEAKSSVAFMFAGGGAQYPNMGKGLYETEPLYRSVVDELLDLLKPLVDFDGRSLLFPPGSHHEAAIELERPSRSLPLLFITQFAQARLWESWGVEPSAFIGHSMGENTAACLAGVFSARDALALVALRGRVFETLPEGGMLSVNARSEELEPLLIDGLGIAARNARDLTVVSGPLGALRRFEEKILERDLSCQRIRINVAAHSVMLEPILKPFGDYLRSISLRPPEIPFVSNLTGTWIKPEEATDAEYWVRHLRETVRFSDGVETLLSTARHALLEVGPGRTLATLAALSERKRSDQSIASSLRHPEDQTPDITHMLSALGQLWQGNADVNWEKFFAGQDRRRISLPTYAFDHARYWIEPGTVPRPNEGSRKPIDEWFYVPVWTPDAFPTPSERGGLACVIGPENLIHWMLPALRDRFERVIEAVTEDDARFEICGPERIRVGSSEEHYRLLVRALASHSGRRIRFYLSAPAKGDVVETLSPLFYLARALSEEDCDKESLIVITHGGMRLPGDGEPQSLSAGSLTGAIRVVAAELQLPTCVIDLSAVPSDGDAILLAAEQPPGGSTVLAYRSGRRLKARFESSSVNQPQALAIREGGVYVITGGFGGLGLTVAEHLARTRGVKLALIGRNLPPDGAGRGFVLAAGGRGAEALQAIERVRILGGEVVLVQCDVSDRTSLRASISSVAERWGRIDGVFHAAGNLSDALVPMQDDQAMREVLAPKVDGTVNLFEVLVEHQPDFLFLFSSTSSLSGVPGQFAYAAANSFEDAFADARSDSSFPVISVNWPAWQRVGMTAALARTNSVRGRIAPEDRSFHLGKNFHYIVDGRDWIVAEHRTTEGTEVLPGAAFVEIAAMAAANVLSGTGAVILSDLLLIQPLVIASEERLVLSVVFDEDRDRFSIYSSRDADAAMRSDWISEHAQGNARRSTLSRPGRSAELAGQWSAGRIESANGPIDHHHMQFGPRWSCVNRIAYGEGHAAIRLRLDDEYLGDLNEHSLHPALFDMATGAATALLREAGADDFYVPVSYGEVVVHAPLPPVVNSHVRYSPLSNAEHCVLDIQLGDDAGEVLVEVNGFTLRRLGGDALSSLRDNPSRTAEPSLETLLSEGITPEEGLKVLDRLLATRGLSRVLIAPYGPEKVFARSADFRRSEILPEAPGEHARPALRTSYVAPSSELERALAAIWQEGLGIDSIGMNDDFFELGGHSLLMIQLVNRARKRTGVRLPLKELYSRPTISGWVELAGEFSSGEQPSTDRPALKRVSREAYRTSENVH